MDKARDKSQPSSRECARSVHLINDAGNSYPEIRKREKFLRHPTRGALFVLVRVHGPADGGLSSGDLIRGLRPQKYEPHRRMELRSRVRKGSVIAPAKAGRGRVPVTREYGVEAFASCSHLIAGNRRVR